MSGGVFVEGFAIGFVVIGEVVRIEVLVVGLARALVDVFEADEVADFEWREGAIEGGDFVDVTTFEAGAAEDGAEGEISVSVGLGVNAFVKAVAHDFSLKGKAVFIESQSFGSA